MANQLLLGSGEWDWASWTKIDASPDSKADYIQGIPPLPDAVKAQGWDKIMAIHFIEHLAPWKARDLLWDCYSILNPGGVLILEQPNINYAAKVLLGIIPTPEEEFKGQFDMAPLYGDPNHRDELMLHRWGYTPDTLSAVLVDVGFTQSNIVVKTTEFHGSRPRDFRLEATK